MLRSKTENNKKTFSRAILLGLLFFIFLLSCSLKSFAAAATCDTSAPPGSSTYCVCDPKAPVTANNYCGKTPSFGNDCSAADATCLKNNPFIKNDVQPIVNVLGALVAVIVTGVIIVGGIQYSIAGDNASATAAAKKRIYNGIIALVIFMFMFAFLEWLIPGGIFQ